MTSRAITALYDDYEAAAKAVDRVEAEGIPQADIALVASNAGERFNDRLTAPGATLKPSVAVESDAADGAGAGASIGTVLGGGAGLLAGLGLIAVPGIGPVVAAGWLVATVTGAGVGAATGGLLGALTGAGLSDSDAETYAEGVRRGGTLVTVKADEGRAQRVMDILKRGGSIDMDERAQDWRAQGWTGGTAGQGGHAGQDGIGTIASGLGKDDGDAMRPESGPKPSASPATAPSTRQPPEEVR